MRFFFDCCALTLLLVKGNFLNINGNIFKSLYDAMGRSEPGRLQGGRFGNKVIGD